MANKIILPTNCQQSTYTRVRSVKESISRNCCCFCCGCIQYKHDIPPSRPPAGCCFLFWSVAGEEAVDGVVCPPEGGVEARQGGGAHPPHGLRQAGGSRRFTRHGRAYRVPRRAYECYAAWLIVLNLLFLVLEVSVVVVMVVVISVVVVVDYGEAILVGRDWLW